MFYVPSSGEIILSDRPKPEEIAKKNEILLYSVEFDLKRIDEELLSYCPKPTMLYDSFQRNVTLLMPDNKDDYQKTLPQNGVISQIMAQVGTTQKKDSTNST